MTAKTNAALKAQMIDRQPLTKAMLDDLVDSKPGQSGALIDADIPAAIARDAEVTSAVGAHVTALHPYKVYIALLSQVGTNAPVATVLQNTLGGIPVWSYAAFATYDLSLAGAFPEHKTWISPFEFVMTSGDNFNFYRVSDDLLEISAISDGNLGNAFAIEIRVYP